MPTLTAAGDRSPETNNGDFQRRRQLLGVRRSGGALARCDLPQGRTLMKSVGQR